MKINLLVALYRDSYFYHDFGSAVRDLQFLDTLAELDIVESVTVINRPVSILERVLAKKTWPKRIETSKISSYDSTSTDLFGAIKGRAWAADVYPNVIDKHLIEKKSDEHVNIFLDFLPIGQFTPKLLDGWLYWYDYIDNFKKHNRFTKKDKSLVQDKYSFVASYANVVSAVSDACLNATQPYNTNNKFVISNKVFTPSYQPSSSSSFSLKQGQNKFDFGFIGFITDKFDVDLVKRIAKNYTVAIFGQVMDRRVSEELNSVANVQLFGKFSYGDISNICDMFAIGLLPYLELKSHDGSPLKLYEYMKYDIPCITSIDYEITDERFIVNYNTCDDLINKIENLKKISGSSFISNSIKDEWKLKFNLNKLLKNLMTVGA